MDTVYRTYTGRRAYAFNKLRWCRPCCTAVVGVLSWAGDSVRAGRVLVPSSPAAIRLGAPTHARDMRLGGVMLVLLGLLQVTGLWLELISRLQGLISSWQMPL